MALKAVSEDAILVSGRLDNSIAVFDTDTIGTSSESGFIALFGNFSGIPDYIKANAIVKPGTLVIYPNPAKDLIKVEFSDDYLGEVSIELIDIMGKQVLTQNLLKSSKEFSNYINLNSIKQGLYTLKTTTGIAFYYKKIIVR
jgi:hypothetical protein